MKRTQVPLTATIWHSSTSSHTWLSCALTNWTSKITRDSLIVKKRKKCIFSCNLHLTPTCWGTMCAKHGWTSTITNILIPKSLEELKKTSHQFLILSKMSRSGPLVKLLPLWVPHQAKSKNPQVVLQRPNYLNMKEQLTHHKLTRHFQTMESVTKRRKLLSSSHSIWQNQSQKWFKCQK